MGNTMFTQVIYMYKTSHLPVVSFTKLRQPLQDIQTDGFVGLPGPERVFQPSGHTILHAFRNYSGLYRTFRLMDWWILQAWIGFCWPGCRTDKFRKAELWRHHTAQITFNSHCLCICMDLHCGEDVWVLKLCLFIWCNELLLGQTQLICCFSNTPIHWSSKISREKSGK